jgi:dienelactone hydrolase
MAMERLGMGSARRSVGFGSLLLCAAVGCGGAAKSPVVDDGDEQGTFSDSAAAGGAGAPAPAAGQGGVTGSQSPPRDDPAGAPAAVGGSTAAVSAGTAGADANTAGSSGSAGSIGSAGSAAGSPAASAAGSPAAAGGAASAQPVLPAIDDPAAPGPFGFEQVPTADGLTTHTLFVPGKLGDQGVKHPILVWMNGATGTTSFYQNMLEHFASHGFFVVADKMSGGNHDPEIVEQDVAITWVLAEAARSDSPYFGKIDPERLGIAGHSLGSVGSFANTGHASVKSSIHWSGGLTGNPVGADEAWLQRIHAPAAFLCGGAEARALPRCSGDFDNAPAGMPIFYGTVAGVGHTDVFGEPHGGEWGRAAIAWWRLTLAGDESFRSWFSGPDCKLCSDPWMGKSRDL